MKSPENDQIVRRMIEAAGHATQSLGMGRVLGQIFAYLYFSREPRSLDDLTGSLGISKGSASMGVRQLEQWDALRKVWIKGDRKDYYSAKDQFGRIIKNAILDLAGKRLEDSGAVLDGAEIELEQRTSADPERTEEDDFIRERIAAIRTFQGRAQGLWSSVILRMLMK